MKMTFEDYDKIEEKMERLNFSACGYWPDVSDLERKFNLKNKADYEFLIWLLNTNPPPETKEEITSKKKITNLLYGKLELV